MCIVHCMEHTVHCMKHVYTEQDVMWVASGLLGQNLVL